MGISVVLLAYREAENLKILLPRIIQELRKTGADYEILLIDAREPLDETPEICRRYRDDHVVYLNQEEDHYAGAFRTGIRHASMDRLLVLDCDGSHDPRYIGEIYAKSMEGYDLVIGSRYCRGGKTHDAAASVVMSKILNTVMRRIIGVKAKDISTSYRMYVTKELQSIPIRCTNYEVLQEVILQMKLRKKDFRIAEIPIEFEKRMYGESKRQLLKFIRTYIRTVFRLIRIRLSPKSGAGTAR